MRGRYRYSAALAFVIFVEAGGYDGKEGQAISYVMADRGNRELQTTISMLTGPQ